MVADAVQHVDGGFCVFNIMKKNRPVLNIAYLFCGGSTISVLIYQKDIQPSYIFIFVIIKTQFSFINIVPINKFTFSYPLWLYLL